MSRRLALALAGGFALLAGAGLFVVTGDGGNPRSSSSAEAGTAEVAGGRSDVDGALTRGTPLGLQSGQRPVAPSAPPTADDLGATTFSDLTPEDLADPAALRARRRAEFAARAQADAEALHQAAGLPAPDPDLLTAARAAAAAARP